MTYQAVTFDVCNNGSEDNEILFLSKLQLKVNQSLYQLNMRGSLLLKRIKRTTLHLRTGLLWGNRFEIIVRCKEEKEEEEEEREEREKEEEEERERGRARERGERERGERENRTKQQNIIHCHTLYYLYSSSSTCSITLSFNCKVWFFKLFWFTKTWYIKHSIMVNWSSYVT